MILPSEGLPMYAGPSRAFKQVGETIPRGTRLKVLYTYEDDGGEAWGLFDYVEYKGVKGWIDSSNGAIGTETDSYSEIILANDIKLNDGSILPANSIVEFKYYVTAWPSWDRISYIEKDDKYGYGKEEDTCFIQSEEYQNKLISIDITSLYEKASTSSKILTKIPKNRNITELCSTLVYEFEDDHSWLYVEYEGKKGWIEYKRDNSSFEVIGEEDEEDEDDEDEIEEINEETEEKTTKVSSTSTIKEENKIDKSKLIIILSIVGSFIIALSAIVTLILIKKKDKLKKNGEELKKEDTNPVENPDENIQTPVDNNEKSTGEEENTNDSQ